MSLSESIQLVPIVTRSDHLIPDEEITAIPVQQENILPATQAQTQTVTCKYI